MAAGAPRHRAPKKARGSTGNVLQALGVAGGGLFAVAVMTTIAGGPAAPDTLVAGSPSVTGVATTSPVAARGAAVPVRPAPTVVTAKALIWSVGGHTHPRQIGPTISAPTTLVPVPPVLAASPTPTPPPTPTPTPSARARVQPPPIVHPPAPAPVPTPTPTPTETPTPTPVPSDPPTTPADPLLEQQPAPVDAAPLDAPAE